MVNKTQEKRGAKKQTETSADLNQIELFSEEVNPYQALAHPFLKWAGGKSFLVDILIGLAPSKFNCYFEPFLGSAAYFFALHPKKAFLSDINFELINSYTVVRDSLDKLCKDLKKHKHNEEYYYKLRDVDRNLSYNRWGAVSKASRLIYLNKTCYNGLYRVNSMGQFNVPFGRYKSPCWLDSENLKACSYTLQKAQLAAFSYEKILNHVQKNDFVYIDPPYASVNSKINITTFNPNGFGQDEQERLKDFCFELTRRNVMWMQSNVSSPLIHELYKGCKIFKVEGKCSINSKTSSRGKVLELVIKNY